MHQEGSSLTPIPGDQELGDAVLKDLGLRRKLGTSQDEVCETITNYLSTVSRLNWNLERVGFCGGKRT